jgi:DNA-binding MarR family transcriptional regulator
MDVESRRDLQLLEALERESTITQRTLASRLGIALGLTNLYLKRLIRKGYVKCVTVSPNRLVYSLTPKGMARKARLTYEFMKYSLDFYRDARQHLRQSLQLAVPRQRRVAIYGTGDAADRPFLGFPVLAIAEHDTVTYDVLIVAVLERPAGTIKLLRENGVPDAKMLMLRSDVVRPSSEAVAQPQQ